MRFGTWKWIYFIALSLFLSRCTEEEKASTQTKTFGLSFDQDHSSRLTISNPGIETSAFSLKIGDNWHSNLDGIAKVIRELPDQTPDENLARKAWRYVCEHSRSTTTLGESPWLHHPLVFLNAVGEGYCDDQASALAFIWKHLGYESRVWGLEGHVVPEVNIDGKWQVYDPSFQTYYLDEEGSVASLESLQGNPELIRRKDSIAPFYPYAQAFGHSSLIAQLYGSSNNNAIAPFYDSLPPLEQLRLPLPAKTKLHFTGALPMPWYGPAQMRDLHFLEFELPQGFKGKLEIPLPVLSIEGETEVQFQGEKKKITADSLLVLEDVKLVLLQDLEILQSASPVLIRCQLNPAFPRLDAVTEIQLTGTQLHNLTIENSGLPPSSEQLRNTLIPPQKALHQSLTQLLGPAAPPCTFKEIQNAKELWQAVEQLLPLLPKQKPESVKIKWEQMLAMLPEEKKAELLLMTSEESILRFFLALVIHLPADIALDF